MEPEKLERIKCVLETASKQIAEIEKVLSPKLVTLIVTGSITDETAYLVHKVVRRIKDSQINLFLESGGGDIDAASKIVKIIRNRFKKFRAIVPYYAKSAATLLAVSADEIMMCTSGELGLVDPQVRDPYTRTWIPAHSIREAMKFIEETEDPLVKLSMAEKMPPLLIGAFRDAQNASRQYLDEAFERLGDKKDSALSLFLEKYYSHGYPIDRGLCKREGLSIVFPDEKLEEMLCCLHETYLDFLTEMHRTTPREEELDILVIQADSLKTVVVNNEDISGLV